MRERERIEIKKFLESEAEIQRKQDEEKAARTRAIEEEFKQTSNALAKVTRENLLKIRDREAYIDPSTIGKRIPIPEAQKQAVEAAEEFIASTPEYYVCPENYETLTEYLSVNGLTVLTPSMFKAAFIKLRAAGLMIERPEPEPEPVEEQEPEERPRTVGGWIGFDPETGEQREYNEYEVDRMDADKYRKVFKLHSMYNVWIDAATGREVRQPT